MEQGFVVGRCPKCMQELRVPEGLEQFSCMYCGARLSQAELVTGDAAPPGPTVRRWRRWPDVCGIIAAIKSG